MVTTFLQVTSLTCFTACPFFVQYKENEIILYCNWIIKHCLEAFLLVRIKGWGLLSHIGLFWMCLRFSVLLSWLKLWFQKKFKKMKILRFSIGGKSCHFEISNKNLETFCALTLLCFLTQLNLVFICALIFRSVWVFFVVVVPLPHENFDLERMFQ